MDSEDPISSAIASYRAGAALARRESFLGAMADSINEDIDGENIVDAPDTKKRSVADGFMSAKQRPRGGLDSSGNLKDSFIQKQELNGS